MSDTGDIPFAFPRNWGGDQWSGLTKREYFVGQALAGLCANSDYMSGAGTFWIENPTESKDPLELLTRAAVRIADYTLAELAKEKV